MMEALAHLHAAGVLYRVCKPENVLISSEDLGTSECILKCSVERGIDVFRYSQSLSVRSNWEISDFRLF
jgi:serine/threonine protein kinase